MRDVLDSLGASVHPRLAITEGMVNMNDVLNTDMGQPIRVDNRLDTTHKHSFYAKEAFPVLQYLNEVKENARSI